MLPTSAQTRLITPARRRSAPTHRGAPGGRWWMRRSAPAGTRGCSPDHRAGQVRRSRPNVAGTSTAKAGQSGECCAASSRSYHQLAERRDRCDPLDLGVSMRSSARAGSPSRPMRRSTCAWTRQRIVRAQPRQRADGAAGRSAGSAGSTRARSPRDRPPPRRAPVRADRRNRGRSSRRSTRPLRRRPSGQARLQALRVRSARAGALEAACRGPRMLRGWRMAVINFHSLGDGSSSASSAAGPKCCPPGCRSACAASSRRCGTSPAGRCARRPRGAGEPAPGRRNTVAVGGGRVVAAWPRLRASRRQRARPARRAARKPGRSRAAGSRARSRRRHGSSSRRPASQVIAVNVAVLSSTSPRPARPRARAAPRRQREPVGPALERLRGGPD